MKKIILQIAFLCFAVYNLSGQEWVLMETGLDTFHDIRFISAVGDNVVWGLAGDYGSAATTKFATSSDGGLSWFTGTVNSTCSDCYASDLIALDGSTAWAIFNGPNSIYKTTDGGAAWLVQSTADMFDQAASYIDFIYFWDADHGLVAGDPIAGVYEMFTTDNGGTTWEEVPSANIPLALAGEYALVGAYGIFENNIYFGTNKGRVFESVDFGSTWTVGTSTWTTRSISGIGFFNVEEGIAVNGFNSSSNAEVLQTGDGGANWVVFNGSSTLPLTHRQGLSVVPGSTFDAAVITGWEGSLYTVDGAANWEIMDDFYHWDNQMTSPTVGWSGGPNGTVYKFNGSLTGVSTDDLSSEAWKMYPNPVYGKLHIEYNLKPGSDITLRVTDILGKEVYSETLTDQPGGSFQKDVETSSWKPGSYITGIREGQGPWQSKMLVKIQ